MTCRCHTHTFVTWALVDPPLGLELTLLHSIFDVLIQITITVRSLVVYHGRHSSLVV